MRRTKAVDKPEIVTDFFFRYPIWSFFSTSSLTSSPTKCWKICNGSVSAELALYPFKIQEHYEVWRRGRSNNIIMLHIERRILIWNFPFWFSPTNRTRGVPSNLLGAVNFEDNSSDSAEDKAPDQKDASNKNGCTADDAHTADTPLSESIENFKEMPHRTALSETSSNNNNTDKYHYLNDNNCDDPVTSDQKNIETNQTTSSSSAQERRDIPPPPPGPPRPENPARLRRYRLNLE